MWILQQKLKAVVKELSKWSRECIGDVFQKVKEFETQLAACEIQYSTSDSENDRHNLHKTRAEYTRWLKMQDSILRQKAKLK